MKRKYLALVVEDDRDLSFIFTEALQSAGFEVEAYQDGGKALSRLAEVAPHLLILDLHLPHVSGLNLLRQIHTEPRLMPTRVIIATANLLLAQEYQGKADLVLLKPVSFGEIYDAAIQLVPGVTRNTRTNDTQPAEEA